MASNDVTSKKNPLRRQPREIIYNVYKYFKSEAELFKDNDESEYFRKIQARVANATGYSVRTIRNICKEVEKDKTTNESEAATRKKWTKRNRLNMSDRDYKIIRQTVSDYVEKYEKLPTMLCLKHKLAETINFKGSENTLLRILREMGFTKPDTVVYCETILPD